MFINVQSRVSPPWLNTEIKGCLLLHLMQRVQARGRGRLVSAGITTAATQQNVNIPLTQFLFKHLLTMTILNSFGKRDTKMVSSEVRDKWSDRFDLSGTFYKKWPLYFYWRNYRPREGDHPTPHWLDWFMLLTGIDFWRDCPVQQNSDCKLSVMAMAVDLIMFRESL